MIAARVTTQPPDRPRTPDPTNSRPELDSSEPLRVLWSSLPRSIEGACRIIILEDQTAEARRINTELQQHHDNRSGAAAQQWRRQSPPASPPECADAHACTLSFDTGNRSSHQLRGPATSEPSVDISPNQPGHGVDQRLASAHTAILQE